MANAAAGLRKVVDSINIAQRQIPTWTVYCLGVLPVPALLWSAQTGGLGREPISALEHALGELALQLLLAGLAITPARKLLGINLLRFRRAIGLLAFLYVSLHLLVWAVLDVQALDRVWADIVKRPYITVGMLGFVLLLPLAMTSNDASVRKLRHLWRKVHMLVYPAVLLGALHFVMVRKGLQLEPLIYLGAACLLVGLRFFPRQRPASRNR